MFLIKHRLLAFTYLILFTLDNVIARFEDNFFKQTKGIVTGDNHSVSLANIAMHFALKPTADTLQDAELFKRFVDDKLWLSFDDELTECIKT